MFTIRAGSEFADRYAMPYDNFELKMPEVRTNEGSADLVMSNNPNPFSAQTTISYSLPGPGQTRIVLTDLYGKIIRTLSDQHETAGLHAIMVDAANLKMSPGVYLCKITYNNGTDARIKVTKMVCTL